MTHSEIMFHRDRCRDGAFKCPLCRLRGAIESLQDARGWIGAASDFGSHGPGLQTFQDETRQMVHELTGAWDEMFAQWARALGQQRGQMQYPPHSEAVH